MRQSDDSEITISMTSCLYLVTQVLTVCLEQHTEQGVDTEGAMPDIMCTR